MDRPVEKFIDSLLSETETERVGSGREKVQEREGEKVDFDALLRGLHQIRTVLQNGQQYEEEEGILDNAVATAIDVASSLLNRAGWSDKPRGGKIPF